MKLQKIVNRLQKLHPKEIDLSLDRILNLCKKLDNPQDKIKEIINFCGLEWQDSCLEYYKNKKSIRTVSFSQARKPIYKDSLKGTAKFKNYIQDLENALSSSKVR